MSRRHVVYAASLGAMSFGLGWVLTAHVLQPPGGPTRAATALARMADTVTASLPSSVPASPDRRPDREARPVVAVEKSTLRASDNAAAAIALLTRTPGTREPPAGLAYAPSSSPADAAPPPAAIVDARPALPPLPNVDLSGLREAIALLRKGDIAGGDAIARTLKDPVARTTLEWLSLRVNPRAAGFSRIMAFLHDRPDWPSQWLRRKAEETIYGDKRDPALVLAFFNDDKPTSPLGELALARALRQSGRTAEATALVSRVWRVHDLSATVETAILREFGDLLTAADHKFRAAKQLYREQGAAALRAADRAGPGTTALAKARIAVARNAYAAGLTLDLVPASLRSDPGYVFARIQYLRRANKTADAAKLMIAAPRDRDTIVDGDAWWTERRILARKLLDDGDIATAYRICADNSAVSHDARVEGEFHAGWIALRFLHDPVRAAPHFAEVAAQAVTPADQARGSYWQGRAAEASGNADAAMQFYVQGAAHSATYYGQLALAKLPASSTPVRTAPETAQGDARAEAVKVAEVLYALGEADLSLPLVIEGVQGLRDKSQVAAMGAVVASYHDARATLLVGKLAAIRGFALDDYAFPTFGIPGYQPVANSAERSVVYAIARQESAFQPRVVSSAGAKGLMQMMTATARVTAQRAGLSFNEAWLTSDPAFNAKLGAAHLGSLLGEQNGSYILTFAAYNAGGGAVKKWISAYGDPRRPDVDPIDWVELIPYTETRHYVQTVMENMEMYQLRFGERSAMLIDRDLRRSGS